ncbi:MAG: FAD-dependent oxidoreductase [Oscillospiraceae bacterium]|jgi:NAD(P)H-nitrite reductase large subunit|nr:FAD-dependent oxidoreductase [Oscillospiraceae bacterium]
MKYVIIGNSAAGVGAVEAIRKNDVGGRITIITDEPHHTYSRPLISYLLLGKTTRERMKYRGDGFYTEYGCELLRQKRVTAIDLADKSVRCSDGDVIPYDKLLVATGSSPLVPPMEGLEQVKNKYTFSSLDDALALEGALAPNSRVLIIGAGLIGLKCAEGIRARVGSVTVVDLAPKALSSILDDEASARAREHLEQNGLRFYLGDSVKTFDGDTASLRSGARVEFDILVLAVGVRPNTALLGDVGGDVGRGITVNEYMETSIPDIYAAGDCTQSVDISAGDIKVMALLPNAYMQGECAGFNMSGIRYPFDKAIPCNAIGFFGMHIITAGSYTGETYFEADGENYKKLFYSDNRLRGFILMGPKPGHGSGPSGARPAYEKAGIYTSLIRERTPLDTIDFGLICKTPGLMAFSKKTREQKLGGEQ